MSDKSPEVTTSPELEIRECSIDGHVVADCPGCQAPMLLGEIWRELILEDGHDVPPCPDCDDEEGDSWREGVDPRIDDLKCRVISGDVIRTVRPERGDGT